MTNCLSPAHGLDHSHLDTALDVEPRFIPMNAAQWCMKPKRLDFLGIRCLFRCLANLYGN